MHLAELYEHPLKSGRGNLVASAEVRREGLANDRRFLVHTLDGTFISGRSHPRLVLMQASWDGAALILKADGIGELQVRAAARQTASVAVWRDRFGAWDQGDEAAGWLSAFLDDEVRLAWLGESQRLLRWDHDRRVTFADAAPCLAIGSASLADLARRTGEALSMRRFRPNLVIEGSEPYEEDAWRKIRVGSVEFLQLDGCSRCEFTTIDPETAERHPRGEPVATLEQFRKNDTGIYFGMNLMPLQDGVLRAGDEVTVLERRKPLLFALGALLDDEDELLADGEARMVCTHVRDEVPGVKTFGLAREDGMLSTWDAGQYVTLRLDLPEGPLRRSFTISSSPTSEQGLEITVKLVDGGRGSAWLHQHLAPGVEVTAEVIAGSFTLQAHPWNSYLFLGAGTGVTPLMALLRDIADRDLDVTVAFHQSSRTRADVLFEDELRALQKKLGERLVWVSRITSEQGYLDHNALLRFCPDLRDRRAFVCGPAGYRSTVRGLLAGAGFKLDRRYHEELFGEAALETPEDVLPGNVTFAVTGKTVASDGRTTLLQLAERAGVNLPSSCRSGDCGTCRVKSSAGEWLLACHTFPWGDQSFEI